MPLPPPSPVAPWQQPAVHPALHLPAEMLPARRRRVRLRAGTPERMAAPAALAVLAAAAAYGVVTDLALRRSAASLATAVGGAVAPLTLLALLRRPGRRSRSLLVLAACVAPWLAWRASPWVVWLDVFLICALTLTGLAFARRDEAAAVTGHFGNLARDVGWSAGRWATGAWWAWALGRNVAAASPTMERPAMRRGALRLLRVVPLLALVVALLASGDALFASWFHLPLSPAAIAGHAALALVGAVSFSGLHHAAQPLARGPEAGARAGGSSPDATPLAWPTRWAGEVLLALGGLSVCLGAFGVTQLVAAAAGRDYVLRRTGLTYAEYARRGFFQLLAVACLSLVTLLVARVSRPSGSPARQRRWCAALSIVVAVETLGLVAVSVRRLGLYEHEYGLTMLRLYSTVFAWWLGAVIVAAALAVLMRRNGWLVPVVCLSAVGGVLAMNVANPESVVVHSQATLARRTGRIDAAHLVGLSPDAAPAMAALVASTDPRDASAPVAVRSAWCAEAGRRPGRTDGGDWLDANHARAEARRLRAAACR